MKEIIKLFLFSLFIFLALPQNTKAFQAEVTDQQNEQNLEMEKIILAVERHLEKYIIARGSDEITDGSKTIPPQNYLTIKLTEEGYQEDEIIVAFTIIGKERHAKLVEIVETTINENNLISKKELETELETKNFFKTEIETVIEQMNINWKIQAKNAAEKYINETVKIDEELCTILSRKKLIKYLVEERQFTTEEVMTSIQEAEIDWMEQAFKQAKYELNKKAYSKRKLIEKLLLEDFSREEAVYGVDQTETDWQKQAQKLAAEYVETGTEPSKNELQNYLKYEGFIADEIKYAVDCYFIEDIPVKEEMDSEELNQLKSNLVSPQKSTTQSPFVPLEEHLISTERNSHPDEIATVGEFSVVKEKNTSQKNKAQVHNKNTSGTRPDRVEASKKETEVTSLFDQPIFAPFVIAVILGNLYLYQKM